MRHALGFLRLFLSGKLAYIFVCMCVSPPLRLLRIGGIMWHDMDLYDWLNKFYSCYMAAAVGIVSTHDLLMFVIEANLIRLIQHCTCHYFYFNSQLKQLYISNKTEHFGYKGDWHTVYVLRHLKEELA